LQYVLVLFNASRAVRTVNRAFYRSSTLSSSLSYRVTDYSTNAESIYLSTIGWSKTNRDLVLHSS